MNFYVTFGQRYHHEAHSVLGMDPALPDKFLLVQADDAMSARTAVMAEIGTEWAFIYTQPEWERIAHLHPAGAVRTIRADDVLSLEGLDG